MKIGQARLSTIAPVQRCILLEPGGWPRSAKCSSAVPEAQPAGRGKVCKGPRQDVRCLHRDDLAAADSRCLSRFSVPLLPKPLVPSDRVPPWLLEVPPENPRRLNLVYLEDHSLSDRFTHITTVYAVTR